MRKLGALAVLILLLAAWGWGQQGELLPFILTEDQVRAVLQDDLWVLKTASTPARLPEGAVDAASAKYEQGTLFIDLVLVEFPTAEAAGGFVEGGLQDPKIVSRDEEAFPRFIEEAPEERATVACGNEDTRPVEFDRGILLELGRGGHQLVLQRTAESSVVVLLRVNFDPAQLLPLGLEQLRNLICGGK